MKHGLAVAFITLALLRFGLAHDPKEPMPKPLATINIIDDSSPDAPFKFWGTAEAYAQTQPEGFVLLWVEDNDVWFQNISSKDMTALLVEEFRQTVRGNSYSVIRHLGRWPAHRVVRLRDQLRPRPDGSIHEGSMKVRMEGDTYNLKPFVKPAVYIHVLAVAFADGSTWKDVARFTTLPDKAKEGW